MFLYDTGSIFLLFFKAFEDILWQYWDLDVKKKKKKKLIQRQAMKRSLVPHNIWPKVQMLCGEK